MCPMILAMLSIEEVNAWEHTFRKEQRVRLLTWKPMYGYAHRSNDPLDCCVSENFKT